jgi:hypothetical protein
MQWSSSEEPGGGGGGILQRQISPLAAQYKQKQCHKQLVSYTYDIKLTENAIFLIKLT